MSIIEKLKEYQPEHEFFIGVDSDGCAFDSMEIKHKKVFIPIAIKLWKLEGCEAEFTKAAELINLYSNLRGVNRFHGLLLTFEYVEKKMGKTDSNLPNYSDLKSFVNSSLPMSNESLEKYALENKSQFLEELIMWSVQSDELFSELVEGLKPFGYVNESLEMVSKQADTMIVSAATTAGLNKDWGDADLLKYMTLVAGQEVGGKQEQLKYAMAGKYKENKALMIGDAPGDMKAAKANGALFYPIMPGQEEKSWKQFYEEASSKFFLGDYAGEYEEKLIDEFLKILSEI